MKYRVKVVCSTVDAVGVNLVKLLEAEYGVDACKDPDCRVTLVDNDTPFLDDLDKLLPGFDGYVVVSRHESRSATPTLSVHHTGNPGDESLGGRPRELAWAWPSLAYWLFTRYSEEARRAGLVERYQVTLEATHHGPTRVEKPVVFIEIGSSEREWSDWRALKALAETLYPLFTDGVFEPVECTRVSGFGDTHYPRVHTRLVLEEGYCYAHIISKHYVRVLDENVARQAVRKSVERVEKLVVLKVPGEKRRLIERIASEEGVEVERR